MGARRLRPVALMAGDLWSWCETALRWRSPVRDRRPRPDVALRFRSLVGVWRLDAALRCGRLASVWRPDAALYWRSGVGVCRSDAVSPCPSTQSAWGAWHRSKGSDRSRKERGERGGATVFACVALIGLIAAALMIGQVGMVVVARHRAQAEADLAALAAGGALEGGAEAGCKAGEEVARRMGSRIKECRIDGWHATVAVARNIPMGLFGVRTVHAVARAGPVAEEQ
ncbi:Rv3654c family TadE-like protein [Nocardia xishanensis]